MNQSVEVEFRDLRDRLTTLEREYNPANENLHFDSLVRADADLYAQLVDLARQGVQRVRQFKRVIVKEGLYGDGMFWYNLFLMISAAAVRVHQNQAQSSISSTTIEDLTTQLVEISEFTTLPSSIGDITKRNYEALGNTLWAFPSEEFKRTVREAAHRLGIDKVQDLVEGTIDRVTEL